MSRSKDVEIRTKQGKRSLLMNTIRTGILRNEDRCDLQDAIGDMTYVEIGELYGSLSLESQDRFTWICFSVLSQDMALTIARQTILARALQTATEMARDAAKRALQESMDELEAERAKLAEDRAKVDGQLAQLTDFHNKMWEMHDDRNNAWQEASHYKALYEAAHKRAEEAWEKVRRYNTIVELLRGD